MNIKLLKYIFVAVLLLTGLEAYAQRLVVSGKVTEDFGGMEEPITGVNVNVVNSQNRSVGELSLIWMGCII